MNFFLNCLPSRHLSLLKPLLVFVLLSTACSSASAASRSVALSGKTISKSKVQVSCALNSRTASRSRQIVIGRAFNGSNYFVIGSTRRRVTRLTARTNLTNSGKYAFICRVTLRSGKVLWSNKLTATVRYPTPRPTKTPIKTPTRAPGLRSCPAGYTSEVVTRVNQNRAAKGAASLNNNSMLARAAQGHTNWMAKNQKGTHGTDAEMVKRIRDTGYVGWPLGENIAWRQRTPAEVVNWWMNSPGHRANILDSRYRNIGVGCIIDTAGQYWWTQNFGG